MNTNPPARIASMPDDRRQRIEALKRELMHHIHNRSIQELGEPLPFALFLFDDLAMHVMATGEWATIREAVGDWAEAQRAPEMQYPLKGN
ncbi:MAG: hypothetical protein AB1647_15140 [Pseudomonadota bacterium]